jgi:hypothetical protein
MGRIPEADLEMRRALALEPHNSTANYFLMAAAGERRRAVQLRLRNIILRQVLFGGVPLPEALAQYSTIRQSITTRNSGVFDELSHGDMTRLGMHSVSDFIQARRMKGEFVSQLPLFSRVHPIHRWQSRFRLARFSRTKASCTVQ